MKPSFLKLLNQPMETTSTKENNVSKNGSAMDTKTNKRRREDVHKSRAKRIKSDRSSDDDSTAAGSGDDWNDEVLGKLFNRVTKEKGERKFYTIRMLLSLIFGTKTRHEQQD